MAVGDSGGAGVHNLQHHRSPSSSNVAVGSLSGTGPDEAVDYFFRSKGLQPLYTRIELSLSASKLSDLDYMSKSDHMAVVYAKKKDRTLDELGLTEALLEELPGQLLTYMRSRNIKPLNVNVVSLPPYPLMS